MKKRFDQVQLLEKRKGIVSKEINVFTCCVGRIATQGKYFLSDSNQVESVLESLFNTSK